MEHRGICFAMFATLLLTCSVVRAQQVDFHQLTTPPRNSVPPMPKESGGPAWSNSVEILSDTKGTDFDPYISKAVARIRANWYNYIPAEARPPQLKSGETVIEFAILKGGKIAEMKIVQPAGYLPMDRAAWGGITASSPFDPLPKEFKGDYLKLRMHFMYNPPKEVNKGQSAPNPTDSMEAATTPH